MTNEDIKNKSEKKYPLGLYKHTSCRGYDDDPGESDYETLLAIGDTAGDLISRWNTFQDAARQKLENEGRHISYIREVPPNFTDGDSTLVYYGNTGGGWAHVVHHLSVKPIKQFDEPVVKI